MADFFSFRQFLAGKWKILVWLVLVFVARNWSIVRSSDPEVDWMLRLGLGADQPGMGRVVVVSIDDDDYRDIFKRKSPLNSKEVLGLIETIAKARPSVIVVDIDTSDEQYRAVLKDHSFSEIPIVWARDAVEYADRGVDWRGVFKYRLRDVRPMAVLGADQHPTEKNGITGLARLTLDADGVVRRYYPATWTRESLQSSRESMCSLATASLETYCKRADADDQFGTPKCRINDSTSPYILELPPNFTDDIKSITAGQLRELSKHSLPAELFRNKIVVLGGQFLESRDFFDLPGNQHVPGVKVWAGIIAAELGGKTIRQPDPRWLLPAELVSLFLLWLVSSITTRRFSKATRLLISATGLILCSWLLSLWTFGESLMFGYFVPSLSVVLVGAVLEFEPQRELASSRSAINPICNADGA